MLMLMRCLIVMVGVLLTEEISASQHIKPLDSGYITRTFNQLIRESHPNWWGNFNLDPMIKPGAIGVIDIGSGVFQPSGEYLSDFETIISPLSEVMKLSSEHVREPRLVVGGKGRLAQMGDAQVQLKWELSKRGAMTSRWVLVEKQSIKDPGKVLRGHLDLLKSIASYESMYDPGNGISQGFGVITSVIMAQAGMNVVALSDGSNWSVSGQASYLQNMLTQVGGEALYSKAEYEGNVLSFLWPGQGNQFSSILVPVAYTFASLDGDKVMLHWIRPIGSFRMIFNNHGDHYVGISLSYTTPIGSQHVDIGLLPFLKQEIDNIPLDATNLTMTLNYLRIMKTVQTHRWQTPLGSWPTGDRHIDIKGSWPMYPSFSIKEEGYSSQ
ncbi:hypothetical protein [Endozoicomonas elysicola]|uniref:Uncharacterized protein n=1 Tax=Endozoicomonas elysicola TaxID=305900 RepID=A0A081K893_9GAMM|nr:hypothetical protein [Endozoicomonas elysicola]KEI70369.1 hypothetical protein GV64_06175 [Endozoicomonas elysicola]